MDLPRIRAVPVVGKISRISGLMVVDFPAPFGPREAPTSRSPPHSGFSSDFLSIQTRTGILCQVLDFVAGVDMPSARRRIVNAAPSCSWETAGIFAQPLLCVLTSVLLFPNLRNSSFLAPTTHGFIVCSPAVIKIATCCTQLTVHIGAQLLCVKNSAASSPLLANGIPGYPHCCEHQCAKPVFANL
jgi:hypothetical protein